MKEDLARSRLARVSRISAALIVVAGAIGVPGAAAQTRLTSIADLRRTLETGDIITVVPSAGSAIAGRLIRFGDTDLEIRPPAGRTPQKAAPLHVTVPLDAIQSLHRARDPVRNGAAIGAIGGAAFAGALFARAVAVDRNELEEWAPLYAGAAAVCTGAGALIGWAIDAAISKPPIWFRRSPAGTRVSVQPVFRRGGGIAVAVSYAR